MLYAVRGLDNTATAAEAFSGPRNLSVLLFVLGVLGVVWSQMRPVGGGQAEDPARIMLVSREARPSLVSLLSNSGFDVVERSGELGEATVDELIEAADHEGVGFVVIQTPTDGASGYVRGSPAEAEGDPWPEDARWVTVSVGDLAFPPKVRAGIDPSTNGYDEGESILGALFDQPRLAPERESLAHNPELKEVLLHAKLEPGLNISRRAESQRRLAYEMELRLAGRLLEGEGVRPLFEPLRIGGGLPVSDMEVLVTERALDFVIEADESMRDELDARISLQLWTLDGHGAEVGRRSVMRSWVGRCAESFKSLRASSDGAHLVLQLKDGTVRFFERGDRPDTVCGYGARGSAVVDEGVDVGVIGARGVTVGVAPGAGGGQLVFRDGDETWRTPEIAGVRLRNPTWFDDARVIVTASFDSVEGHPRSGLLLVNALEPQRAARLELPLPAYGGAPSGGRASAWSRHGGDRRRRSLPHTARDGGAQRGAPVVLASGRRSGGGMGRGRVAKDAVERAHECRGQPGGRALAGAGRLRCCGRSGRERADLRHRGGRVRPRRGRLCPHV